jgi:hypothetical protein
VARLISDPATLGTPTEIDRAGSRPLDPEYFDPSECSGLPIRARGSSPYFVGAIKVINNFNRLMTRLFYRAPSPFERRPKDCG